MTSKEGLRLGLDFGTSNCSAAIWTPRGVTPIPIDGNKLVMPSALFVPVASATPFQPEEASIDRESRSARVELASINRIAERHNEQEREKERRAKSRGERYQPQLRGTVALNDASLRTEAIARLRRAHADIESSRLKGLDIGTRLASANDILIGEAAVLAYLEDPAHGDYFPSPKTFLAADIKAEQRNNFVQIVTRMLRAIHDSVTSSQNRQVERVVIGRPVEFHGGRGASGETDALESIRTAAGQAGFAAVDFEFEPIAAAMDYELRCERDEVLLVLDCGGGTTDCSIVRVGPSQRTLADRSNSVLANRGIPEGGLLLDVTLSKKLFAPIFGQNTLLRSGQPVPSAPFFDALDVHSLPAQRKFLADAYQMPLSQIVEEARDPTPIGRLQIVRERNLSQQLRHGAEKIRRHLSDQETSRLELHAIENGLSVTCSREQLRSAVENRLERMLTLVEDALADAGFQGERVPDAVYLTGGVAQSPLLRLMLAERFPALPLPQTQDFFGSVASGLARVAGRGALN